MRSRIGTESTITTTIGPTESKSHWISLKTEVNVLCRLPESTAGTKQSILVSQYNAVQPRIVLCCPPPHVDLIPGWQTRNAYLHWRKPRLVIHRNRICILCFVPHTVCHCAGETSLRNRAQQISHCVKRGALASANINHDIDQPWLLAPWKVDQFTLSWIISFQA